MRLFGFGTNILVNLLDPHRIAAFRPEDARRHGLRPHPAGAGPDAVPEHRITRGWPTGLPPEDRPRRRVRAAVGHQRAAHVRGGTFVVMLPINHRRPTIRSRPGEAGLTWVFVQSFVLMAGGFMAPIIRRITPRAALLGSLAGISITFISMSPAAQIFDSGDRHRLLSPSSWRAGSAACAIPAASPAAWSRSARRHRSSPGDRPCSALMPESTAASAGA